MLWGRTTQKRLSSFMQSNSYSVHDAQSKGKQ